jgi:hypothetical protein
MRILAALALALALGTAARLPAAWESGNALNHVSGTWMTLADDLSRGTLYRPLAEAGEYGGTRYFPLAFAAQAGLLRLGAPRLAAAYGASLAAGAFLALGVFLLLRAGGGPRGAAAASAALAFAGFAGQHALSAGRGDLLPVALSALALAAIARGPTPGRVAAAGVLLALSFAAKPTALTAAGAAVAFLALRRARGAAVALAALVAAGAGAALVATDALSSGRFLAGLRALASGGARVETALRAPVRLAEELAVGDPAGLVLALGGAAAFAASLPALRRSWGREASEARRASPRLDDPRLLPALWLAAAWAGALAVFASPGTGVNHLVEIEAASAALLGACALAPGRARAVARAAAPAAALAGIVLVAALVREDLASSRLAEIRAVVRALPAGRVLSEDPLVPLLAGERPAVLDAFSLRLAAARDPALAGALSGALRRGEFAAVVLFADPGSPAADAWYAEGNLGLPLARAIAAGYRRGSAIGRYRLHLPRDESKVVRRDGAR